MFTTTPPLADGATRITNLKITVPPTGSRANLLQCNLAPPLYEPRRRANEDQPERNLVTDPHQTGRGIADVGESQQVGDGLPAGRRAWRDLQADCEPGGLGAERRERGLLRPQATGGSATEPRRDDQQGTNYEGGNCGDAPGGYAAQARIYTSGAPAVNGAPAVEPRPGEATLGVTYL